MPDRYILCGKIYSQIKTSIDECITQRNDAALEAELKKHNPELIFPYLLIALYKNVTSLYKDMCPSNVPVECFESILTKRFSRMRTEWQPIIGNALTHNLKISKENWKHIELSLLVVQFKHFLPHSKSKLAEPLVALIKSPERFVNAFLPCMPQDTMFEVYSAIRASAPSGQNPTIYECPNGHPYVLFDCGRPWVLLNCKVIFYFTFILYHTI